MSGTTRTAGPRRPRDALLALVRLLARQVARELREAAEGNRPGLPSAGAPAGRQEAPGASRPGRRGRQVR